MPCDSCRADPEVGDVDSALAYDWDIVLRGPAATPFEHD